MPIRYYQEIDDDTGGAPLRREISITTVSDAVTLPGNPGPGRTLDKALVWGGQRLERVITGILSRTGRGPTSSIKEIMRAVYQSLMTPRACGRWWKPCGYWGPPHGINTPPTVYELPIVCEWLVHAGDASRCPKCGWRMTEQCIRTPLRSSKKLVKLISASSNNTSCYISLQLITLLVTMFPGSRQVFTDMGASEALQGLSRRMSDQLEVDPLLASSRRALVSLVDAEILSLGKELAEVMRNEGIHSISPVLSELIACFSHTEKMVLALTVAQQFPGLLDPLFYPVLKTIYPMLLSRLASSSDPVEVAVLTDCLYRIIDRDGSIPVISWLIPIIKTRPDLLEHIPYRLRRLIDRLPAKYEQEAIDNEQFLGRRVNRWRRAIWRYDPDDLEGEPDNDKFFKWAARDDGEDGYAKIDAVWWEAPVWETCTGRKRRLEGWEEQGMEDREQCGRDGHRGRRPRAQSMTITSWPHWMKGRLMYEAWEWKVYWEKAAFVNFTGWPRKVGIWLEMEPEPDNEEQEWRDQAWAIYWTKLSTRMRSRSVD